MTLSSGPITSIALIGAHCDDVAIGAGATLLQLTRENPGVVVHVLVLTGAGTEREVEEKTALSVLCGSAEVRLTVGDLPDGRLPQHWGDVKARLRDFRQTCSPDLVFGPRRDDAHQDHRLLAELIPTEFRDHVTLGYEIVKWESDLLGGPSLYHPADASVAHEKVRALRECYPSQAGHDWFDDESFLGLMRVRGVQCRHRYAEAFVADKCVLDLGARG